MLWGLYPCLSYTSVSWGNLIIYLTVFNEEFWRHLENLPQLLCLRLADHAFTIDDFGDTFVRTENGYQIRWLQIVPLHQKLQRVRWRQLWKTMVSSSYYATNSESNSNRSSSSDNLLVAWRSSLSISTMARSHSASLWRWGAFTLTVARIFVDQTARGRQFGLS